MTFPHDIRLADASWLRATLGLLVLHAAFLHSAAASASGETLSGEQKRRLAALKHQAAGRDFEKALEAIGEIASMGPAAQAELEGAAKALLLRSKSATELATRSAGTPERIAPLEEKLKELRAEALANIAKLDKSGNSLAKAQGYYTKLLAASKSYFRTMEARSRLIDVVVRRVRLKGALEQAGVALTPEASASEPAPIERAAKALGVSLDNVRTAADLEGEAAMKDVFAYRLNRRTAAFNKLAARSEHREELRNAVIVNDYREALGLLRLEFDLRLVQSARRHSKEMVDLRYFSHTSPVKANKGFADRCKAAGYTRPGGENIAMGSHDAAGVFKMWFNSPGHHQNMVRDQFTGIGVGKWGRYWTQNFGSAARLVDADEAARQAAAPKGALLPRER